MVTSLYVSEPVLLHLLWDVMLYVRACVVEAFKLLATRTQRNGLRVQEPDIYQTLLISARSCLLFLDPPKMISVAGDESPNSCLGARVDYLTDQFREVFWFMVLERFQPIMAGTAQQDSSCWQESVAEAVIMPYHGRRGSRVRLESEAWS